MNKDIYYITLESFDHVCVIRTKIYNSEVRTLLEWAMGIVYTTLFVIKNGEFIEKKKEQYCFLTKEEVIQEAEDNYHPYFEEDRIKRDAKIALLKKYLVEGEWK